ncbi:hypothetical protein [Thermotoga sp.]
MIYTDKALEAAVYLSKRYITDHFLPDKALHNSEHRQPQLPLYERFRGTL